MKITFERIQQITIETADDSLTNHEAFYWTDWANNSGAFSGKSILNRMFDEELPTDRPITRNPGRWVAVGADPPFASDLKPPRRQRT